MDQYSHHHRPPSKNVDITILEAHHSSYVQSKNIDTTLSNSLLDF